MNPIVALVIVVGMRLIVSIFLDVMLYYFRLNYIVVPELGWKREALEILITMVLVGPIFVSTVL